MATTNEKKITRVDALNVALNLVENATLVRKDEIAQKLKDLIASIEKKSTSSKPTAKQIANENAKANIVALLDENPDQRFTVTDLLKHVPDLPEDASNQWMTQLLRQLCDKNDPKNPSFPVSRFEEKGRAYFQSNPDYMGD